MPVFIPDELKPWANVLANRLASSRKSQKVVNLTHIQLTCDQLVLTCAEWPNGVDLRVRLASGLCITERKKLCLPTFVRMDYTSLVKTANVSFLFIHYLNDSFRHAFKKRSFFKVLGVTSTSLPRTCKTSSCSLSCTCVFLASSYISQSIVMAVWVKRQTEINTLV